MENELNTVTKTNPATATTATATIPQEIDYKALYEKATAEAEKQKGLKDQYAKENAEYKRKAQEAMTDDQKKAEAEAEREKVFNQMQEELAEIKLEKEILANGFTADESEKLKGLKIPQEAIKTIAEIITARLDKYASSLKANEIKETTPTQPMGVVGNAGNKSYAQKLAEKQFSSKENLDNIKNIYR